MMLILDFDEVLTRRAAAGGPWVRRSRFGDLDDSACGARQVWCTHSGIGRFV
jgi:hypothetical protein